MSDKKKVEVLEKMSDNKEFFEEDYEEDIYDSSEVIDELMEADEIDSSEDAFLKGYDEDAEKTIHRADYDETLLCPNCGEILNANVLICNVCGQDISDAVSM